MREQFTRLLLLTTVFVLSACLFGCSQNSLTGNWTFDDGKDAKTATFDADGTFAIDADGYLTGEWSEYKVKPTISIDGKTWNVYVYTQDESDPEDDVCFFVNGNELYVSMQRYIDLLEMYEENDIMERDEGKNAFEMVTANHATRNN